MINNFFIVTSQRGVFRFVNILKTAAIARILSPSQFGEIGLVIMFISLFEMLTETGINTVLTQNSKKIDTYAPTALAISIIRGLLISLLLIISSFVVPVVFDVENIQKLFLIASLLPIIRGFINPMCISFAINLQFAKDTAYKISILLFETIITLLATFYLQNSSALIIGMICGAIFEAFLSWIIFNLKSIQRPSFKIARSIIGSGKWMTVLGLSEYFFTNLDNLVVAKVLGSNSLGIYQNSYKLSTLPMTEINDIVFKVNFPFFSKIKNTQVNLSGVVNAFVRVGAISFVLTLVSTIFFAVFAKEITHLVLGPKWSEAAEIIRLLSVLGLFRSISNLGSSLLISFNKQSHVSIVSLVGTISLCISIWPLVNNYGIFGAAYSAILSSLVAIPVSIYFLIKILTEIKS